MAIEIGDLVAGEGRVGRVVDLDGSRVTVMPFPPQDQPNMRCVAFVVDHPRLIAKARPKPRTQERERER